MGLWLCCLFHMTESCQPSIVFLKAIKLLPQLKFELVWGTGEETEKGNQCKTQSQILWVINLCAYLALQSSALHCTLALPRGQGPQPDPEEPCEPALCQHVLAVNREL